MSGSLSASFLNVGISPMIEKLLDKYGSALAWYMDDGFFVGNEAEVEDFWFDVKRIGPSFGYYVNSKSKIFSNKHVNSDKWTKMGLDSTSECLELLGTPIGKESFVKNFTYD